MAFFLCTIKLGDRKMNEDLILITGTVANSDENSIKIYENVIDICREITDKVLSPLDTMKFNGSNKEKYERAMELLIQTKLIIAEMTVPSTGQGMELQQAVNLGIPIIIIAETGSKISSLLLGTDNIQSVIYYDDFNMLKTKLAEELNKQIVEQKFPR